MAKRGGSAFTTRFADAAAAKSERVQALLAKMQERQHEKQNPNAVGEMPLERGTESRPKPDANYRVLSRPPNEDLVLTCELFDDLYGSDQAIHAALFWPHLPPRLILPWMVREVSRGRAARPSRTLFVNMSRSALQDIAGVEASTATLRARGVNRSGRDETPPSTAEISPDAHFFMFLGQIQGEGPKSVPLISIIPHAVAMNDGVYWRDFDEKTLKGMKKHFSLQRLNSIRKHLDVLTSKESGPAFAFLLPAHFEKASRQAALRQLPEPIDQVVIDLSTQALGGRNVRELVNELVVELEASLKATPKRVLIVSDCPLRFNYACRSLKNRLSPGALGTRLQIHRRVWSCRGRGFDTAAALEPASRPIVETIASAESVIATRLWVAAHKLDNGNPLRAALKQGGAALKGMALTAAGADAILKPYTDTHDAYHRIKRKRHSFEPHFAEAMIMIGEGKAGAWRDTIEADLKAALRLAESLRQDTPLMRFLKRYLSTQSSAEDVLLVLRHPEDVQQTTDLLWDYLTSPENPQESIPNLRLTTPSRYASELATKPPTIVVWAASSNSGMRAYLGDSFSPREFVLVVTGHDSITLRDTLELSADNPEFAKYRPRSLALIEALPRAPKELGAVWTAFDLDLDRPRVALPFVGTGYMLLDGYGKVSASPGTQFYVLDPVSQQLHPREARSIEIGDSVFVMSDAIREEIEASLREKDEQGRTFEQAMVDQYKTIVKAGIEKLSAREGKRITASRVHEMLFADNPGLPPIGKQAVDYWLQAADKLNVDTPYAASDPVHFEAFLKVMGAGILAGKLSEAVRVVRSALQRDGNSNRAIFDRLLLDPDSLIHTNRRVTFEKLHSFRSEAMESVFPVLGRHFADAKANVKRLDMASTA